MADPAFCSGASRESLAPVLAGVVVFKPDTDRLRELVQTLSRQASGVVLFLNSDLPDALRHEFDASAEIILIEAAQNLGIGVGLNMIALAACLRQACGIVFFDQDSRPSSDLLHRLSSAWTRLVASGQRPAVVSPMLVAEAGAASKAPTYRYRDGRAEGGLREVAFVPTSGSLITTEVLRRVGFFRADFFIDGIDVEWSFRAASLGYSCWVHTDCPMPHAVGTGIIGGGRLGWSMPKQRPFRMYCVIRNTIYGLRLRHIPLGWKVRQIAYLPIQAGAFAAHHRLGGTVVRQLLAGLRDGIAGRLGVPKDLPR